MSTSSTWSCSGNSPSNLERFLQCVTPVIPSQSFHQSYFNDVNRFWKSLDKDTVEFFSLKDLWDCYYEWSAYGAGTPVMLEETSDPVVHYYVPYLSAIQIYTNKPVGATSRVEFESDSWSDDSGSDNLSRSLSNNSSKTWDVSEDSSSEEGSSPTKDKLGHLYLSYFETASPYLRVPLMEKIPELARNHPALMTLKSVDLSPASWMAVSWYPIYTIPTRKNDKDLEACFLTYHTLSSSFQDCAMENEEMEIEKDGNCSKGCDNIEGEQCKKKESGNISLPPFGLATYKMQGDLWLNDDPNDNEKISYLFSAAESWLKQLNVHHHDFNFFIEHAILEIGS